MHWACTHQMLVHFLQSAFPGATFNVVNLARSATDIVPAATCWYHYVPTNVDLVLIEESTIGCYGNLLCHTFAAPRVSSWRKHAGSCRKCQLAGHMPKLASFL
jgi:hypothetical protein